MREGLGVWGCESEGGLYVLLESKQRWYSISEGKKKKRKKEHKVPNNLPLSETKEPQ